MNENENLVLDEGTENVGATATEEIVEQVAEPEKVYTEEEFNNKLNEVTGKRDARTKRKYDRKYGGLIDVLKAGTGIEDVDELTNTFKDFYSKKGVQFATEPTYSAEETEVLAKADADKVIDLGYEDVVEEINRYADIGVENLSAREKATLQKLAEHQNKIEQRKELARIGVSEDVLESKAFKDFSKQFVSNTPITEIYKLYNQTQPKKQIKPMGSIKSNATDKGMLKDFYTKEEAMKFTKEDFDKNPALFQKVCEDMAKW